MITKKDFNKVWKDTSKETVLNQFYYEHYELIKYKEVIDKAIEYIWKTEINSIGIPLAYTTIGKDLLDILKEVK